MYPNTHTEAEHRKALDAMIDDMTIRLAQRDADRLRAIDRHLEHGTPMPSSPEFDPNLVFDPECGAWHQEREKDWEEDE